MKTYSEEQVIEMLDAFNKDKGKYGAVSRELIIKWFHWFIAFKSW